jgi:hypothetical protein
MRWLGGIILMVVAAAACSQPPEPKRYEVRGQILSFDPQRNEVVMDHEDIEGFMPAMVMPYKGLFYDASWIAVYVGQGLLPERHDARTRLPDPDGVAKAMAGLRSAIADEIAGMPGHRAYLAASADRLAAAL